MPFFYNEEDLLGGVELLFCNDIFDESVNISNNKKLGNLRIYLRTRKEASRGGKDSIRHGPSFKVYEKSTELADVFILKNDVIKIKGEKNLPAKIPSYIRKFTLKNYDDIVRLWNIDPDDYEKYREIVNSITRNNPQCNVKYERRNI